jgi:exopolysaccharide production protein ExoQ
MLQNAPRRAKSRTNSLPLRGQAILNFMPPLAFLFVVAAVPLQSRFYEGTNASPETTNRIFWLALGALISILLFRNWQRLDSQFMRSAPIATLGAYLMFSAASVTWAYNQEASLVRFIGQLVIVAAVVVPYALSMPLVGVLQRMLFCCAIALLINILFVVTRPATDIGHFGYYSHKQQLGMIASVAVILALHELIFRGWRRIIAVFVICAAIFLLLESRSKGSYGLLFLAIGLSALTLILGNFLRVSPAIVVGSVALALAIYTRYGGDPLGRIAYELYGDPTLTGRTFIWEFMDRQISRNSWFGWGFHSYWSLPVSPHSDAPGFVKEMVSSHSGYMDLKLETGHLGYWIFLLFIYSALHLAGSKGRHPLRAWFLLSLIMFCLLINLQETTWATSEPLWVLYLVVICETVQDKRLGEMRAATHGQRRFAGRSERLSF